MKKTVNILIAIVFSTAILSTSCKKEDTNPPATQGSNSCIVGIDTFEVQPNQWVMTSAGYYKYVKTNTAITQQIVTEGTLNAYVKDYMINNAWYALPDVVAGGAGYRFSYELNTVTLFADNFMSGVPRPLKFRVLLIK